VRRQQLRNEMLDAIIATVCCTRSAPRAQPRQRYRQQLHAAPGWLREVDADRWAIITRGRRELRLAYPRCRCVLFLAATGGGTLRTDPAAANPSGLKRVRDLLVQTRALLDEKDPVNAHVLDGLDRQPETVARLIFLRARPR
jgi:hypothetical protein